MAAPRPATELSQMVFEIPNVPAIPVFIEAFFQQFRFIPFVGSCIVLEIEILV